ncbi:MAG: hypothetical protein ACP5I6_06870 [Caldisphaera sp.]|nr:hypothetical protein [Caldisphaera sp.]PMP88747.1 MAG: hypothetical protein C0172_01935 [Caldisphaera sp.]
MNETGNKIEYNDELNKKIRVLETSKNYFKSSEVTLSPILMSSGLLIAIISNIIQEYRVLSLSLVVIAITLAFAGSAMEITFLLILKRIENLVLNKKDSLVLNVIYIAVTMMLYFIIIGMPIVNYYESSIVKRLSSSISEKPKCMYNNPIISLVTLGYSISIFQTCIGINMLRIIDAFISITRQSPSELFST